MTELEKMNPKQAGSTIEDALYAGGEYLNEARCRMTLINHLNGIQSGGEDGLDGIANN